MAIADPTPTPEPAPPPTFSVSAADRSHWPTLLEQIDAQLYRYADAESAKFRLQAQSDETTWLAMDRVTKYLKKVRPDLRPQSDPWGAEVARLGGQVKYDFSIHGLSIDLDAIDLDEVVSLYKPKEIPALSAAINHGVNASAFGSPNWMMLTPDQFFAPTEVVTAVTPVGNDVQLTVATPTGTNVVTVDGRDGIPLDLTYADGSRMTFTFDRTPLGALLTSVTAIDAQGAVGTRLVYHYTDQDGMPVVSSEEVVTDTTMTLTFTNWSFVDEVAPFLRRSTVATP